MNWRRLLNKRSEPEVRLVPTEKELDTAKLESKWDVTLYEGGDTKAKFEDVREIETDGWKISFDDSNGFGHEFYGFEYRLDERV